ncbi:MAG: VWA domain-containing protein, partial [Candidatus Hydrogenedentes bacterium]|nr:VWA domain-containing protein [Candidatus Hydrogenedentota bacterium]
MIDFFPRFTFPLFLLLLVLVPWSIHIGTRIRSLRAGRKWTAISLRTVILLCVIGALAGAEIVKRNDQLAVFFLLDQSNSIPEDQRQAAAQWVRNVTDAYMSPNVSEDQAGVIVFGDDASIELKVGAKAGLEEIRSYIEGDGTDMAEAVRLAMAAFPQGFMRRVVILSDGNETDGSVLEETKIAQAAGVEVNTVPLHIESGTEVRVREVTAPGQANADEPFQLRIVVYSDKDAPATLQIYQRAGTDRRMLPPQDVQLQKGDNVFLLTQELGTPGFYEYEVNVESPADTVLANNVGRTFTTVLGEPTLLFVENTPENAPHIVPALEAEGLQVQQMTSFELPTSLAQFQAYDAVVLSDVSATDLTSEQLSILEAMVRDHGIGLVMLGGPNTFGAGGFLDTPVEKALPVSMDIKQRKVLPRGALAVVMHTCEIPDGNVWAREIALAALNVLASQDLMGVLGYMWNSGDSWIYKLSTVGDKRAIAKAIRDGAEQIGDMPDVAPTLKMAYSALSKADAAVKRIIMISDGDPAAPTQSLLNDLTAAKIA